MKAQEGFVPAPTLGFGAVQEFAYGMQQGAPRPPISDVVIERFLDETEAMRVKNKFNPRERNMLILLEIFKEDFQFTDSEMADLIGETFRAHQLSLDGFSRLSLERMIGGMPGETDPDPRLKKR